jgi:hypothetical protein
MDIPYLTNQNQTVFLVDCRLNDDRTKLTVPLGYLEVPFTTPIKLEYSRGTIWLDIEPVKQKFGNIVIRNSEIECYVA